MTHETTLVATNAVGLAVAVVAAIGAGVARLWRWGTGAALVFALALSVGSTVVLLRALEERGSLDSVNGRIAVGWRAMRPTTPATEVHAILRESGDDVRNVASARKQFRGRS